MSGPSGKGMRRSFDRRILDEEEETMKDQKEVEEYLASIRQTIAKSENLVAEAELRIAEYYRKRHPEVD